MKLVVSGGGTGGHVYPALAVIDAMINPTSPEAPWPSVARSDIHWIGSQDGFEEELVARAGLQFYGLPAGGLRGMGFTSSTRNAVRIARSVGSARVLLARLKPEVVFVTGGYACVAVAIAARTQRIPVLIYLPDVVPGQAIRFLSRFAARVAVSSEESFNYLDRDKVVVTGYPVRPELFSLDRARARRSLALDPQTITLLVFGGSRGARSINQAIVAALRDLLPICQMIHISGRLDAEWVAGAARSLPQALRERYHHYAYLHEMSYALAAADLAVTRAGAATLGELPAVGLPAVLVPYPHSGQHQLPNAEHLAQHGAARVLPDDQLAERLLPMLVQLLEDPDELARMRSASKAMARPDAADAVARLIFLVARKQPMAPTGERS